MERLYKITCQECGAERVISIDNFDRIDWKEDGGDYKIVSARKRLDGEWGFQCNCGNNDIMTDQERRMIRNFAQPQPSELKAIVSNLVIQKPAFNLETV